MAMITWCEDLKTGIDSIDEEHKVLIKLTNDLYSAILVGKGKQAIGKTLRGLVLYIASHFEHEEEYMFTTKYPEYKEHLKEHDTLRAQVMQLQAGFHNGASDNMANELFAFLKGWVMGHILHSDLKLAPHLKKHGIK